MCKAKASCGCTGSRLTVSVRFPLYGFRLGGFKVWIPRVKKSTDSEQPTLSGVDTGYRRPPRRSCSESQGPFLDPIFRHSVMSYRFSSS